MKIGEWGRAHDRVWMVLAVLAIIWIFGHEQFPAAWQRGWWGYCANLASLLVWAGTMLMGMTDRGPYRGRRRPS